ncbi:Kinesin light chain [Pleurostoma richardsiae]|uniref:Kinesin light chain n=1 Tax=Pleurostoma richardsiae TaxID=41990 RepID=A0AA38VF48_9PEZI|nr:Kinesin light chain [Pleurostoma richardsiae]
MNRQEQQRRDIQGNWFGDGSRIHQGDIHNYHLPHRSSRIVVRNLPFPRNEDVVIRDHIFANLDRLLPVSSPSQSAALWGLGGSGKTQIALAYAYKRSGDPACSIFWVHADDRTTFTQDYKLISTRLGLAGNLEGAELLAAVRGRIEADPCWLLVLDNADDLGLFGVGQTPRHALQGQSADETSNLYDFVPRGTAGLVLWTSRDKRIVGSLVGPQRGIEVAHMTDSEAKLLFESVRNETISDDEVADAEELLQELGRLPLSISQAAAYMRRTSTPIREYMSKLRSRRKRWKMLQENEFDRHRRRQVSNSVLETWDISVEHIRQENKMAYDILHSLAFLDNQNIPLKLIHNIAESYDRESARGSDPNRRGSENESDGSEDGIEDDEQIIEAATRLQEFSFLRLLASEQGRAYEMHKLMQEATRYNLSKKQAEEAHFSHVALHAICDLFPERRRELWDDCERYLVHAQRVGEWAELCKGEVEASALLSRVSAYLYDRGRWREKEPVDRRAHKLRRKTLGDRHPDTLRSMASLATTYHQQGRYKEAETIMVEVLALRKEVLGDKHPDTIKSMAELATTYHQQGRYNEAETIKVEVLALRKEVLGDKHPDTIKSMAELATTYHQQGRYNEAETIYMEVLALRKEVLGDKHPDTIKSMADLAATYHQQGRYGEDEKISGEVLALRKEVLGDQHPDTAYSMHDLAITWHSQDRVAEAISMMEDCFRLQAELLGQNHPYTQASCSTLNLWKMDG